MTGGRISRSKQERTPGGLPGRPLVRGRALPAAFFGRRKQAGSARTIWTILSSALVTMVGLAAGLAGLGLLGVAGAYLYFTRDLPSLDEVRTSSFETTKIYDRNWELLYEVSDPRTGWRTHITLEEMSPLVTQATIAVEDATFYENPGVDARAVVRAVYINVSGLGSSGGSTITMQLVRNVLPLEGAFEASFTRKIKEVFLALEFGRRFAKDDILEMYLNEVYYGNRAYGIEAASQVYFGKQAKNLDLAEASLLAGLPQAPSLYDPTKNYRAAKERQEVVLDNMVRQGFITADQASDAAGTDLRARLVRQETRVIKAPHFVNYVLSQLEQRYGAEAVTRGGLIVQTTLDYPTQVMAQDVVHDHVETLKARNGTNGALVAIQPWSGQIISMVGSADYYDTTIDGQVNVATRERQPGSAFKPISYAAAMMKGWAPSTMIVDVQAKYPSVPGSSQCDGVAKTTERCYIPENFDFKFSGPVSVRESLGRSLNIPAVKAIKFAGVAETINLAHDLGIKTGLWRGLSFYGLAITLGGGEVQPLELAAAYATFGNGGVYRPTTAFLKITNGAGAVLEEFDAKNLTGSQAVTPEVAYMISDILKDDSARSRTFGAGSILHLGLRPAAAKTGSTTDNRDGWTAGYTTELAVAVWVGNSNNSPTQRLDGVVSAGPIWGRFLRNVYSDPDLRAHYKANNMLAGPDGKELPVDFPRPSGIVEATICPLTGQLAANGRRGIFAKSNVPTRRCGELSPEDLRELQDGLRVYRELPNRFFPDGRQKLFQLAAIARLAAPRDRVGTPAPGEVDETDYEWLDPFATPGPDDPAARPDGTPVDLSAPVVVPDVVKLPEAEAQQKLRAAGLIITRPIRQRQADMPAGVKIDHIPIGAVIATNPGAGSSVPRGTVVTILVRAPD